MSASRLQAFLAPRSIALVGIPGDVRAALARPLGALRQHGFPGAIYPINPRHASIAGLACYPSLAALPERPDVAWIAVPGSRVLDVLDECVAAGVRHAVVVSAGFAESDEGGAARQHAIAERARRHGLTVLGPNSIGFVNVWDRVPLSFSTALTVPAIVAGEIAIVSQSGGLGGALFNRLQDRNLGVSYLISSGNEADVGLSECVDFLVDEPRTGAIVLVVEGVRDGAEFRRVTARALEADKPVIALRLGTTPVGGRLARSHTGAIVGERRAWDAVATQLGIVTVDDIADVVDVLIWSRRAGGGGGRRVSVITSSGGAAVHLADRLSTAGFELPPIGDAAQEALRGILPAYATPSNPLDITAGLTEATFEAAATAMVGSGDFDALVIPLTMLSAEQSETRVMTVAAIAQATKAPVALCWLGGSLTAPALGHGDRLGVASFPGPGGLIRAMTWIRRRHEARERRGERATPAPAEPVPSPGRGLLGYGASCALLERFRIAQPRQVLAAGPDAAIEAARTLRYPLAAKAVGADFVHKSDRGALRLGIRDAAELGRAVGELATATAGTECEGLLVQEMVEGFEVVVGVVRDDIFGLLLLVGPGGTAVELSDEHRCLPLPAGAAEVRAALDTIPSFRRLDGWRHEPRRDRDALVETVLRVGRLATALGPGLRELDLNPILVGAEGHGATAVDVLIVMDDR